MANFGKWAMGLNIVTSIASLFAGDKLEKQAQEKIEEADKIINEQFEPMQEQRKITSNTIRTLAQTEIKVYNTTMTDFVNIIRLFDKKGKIHIQGFSKRKIKKIEREVFKYTKVADKRRLAKMAGGLAVVEMSVVYGGTQFFGKINGKKIINMDRNDRRDATLAYLGDGSITKGKLVMGGVALTSFGATLASNIWQEANNKLEAAKTYYQKAKKKSIELKLFTGMLKSINEIAIIDIECLTRLSCKMDNINKKVVNIYNSNVEIAKKRLINIIRSFFGIKPKINLLKLKETDLKTIFEYQQCAVLINHIIKLGILNKNGNINAETKKELEKIYSEMK